jgi:hypothetical protein
MPLQQTKELQRQKIKGLANNLNQAKSHIEVGFRASKENTVMQNERFIKLEEKEEIIFNGIKDKLTQHFSELSAYNSKTNTRTLETMDRNKNHLLQNIEQIFSKQLDSESNIIAI